MRRHLAALLLLVTSFASSPMTAVAASQPSTLTVVKEVVGGGPKIFSDFPLFIQKQGPNPNAPTQVTSGVANPVETGTYDVTETSDANYTASYSGDCVDNHGHLKAVSIGNNQNKTCTITNTYSAPPPTTGTVTLQKIVSGGTATVSDFSFAIGETPVTLNLATSFSPGTYVVSETGPANYEASYSAAGQGGSITVSAGQEFVCTITNTYVAPPPPAPTTGTVTVFKHVVDSDAPASSFSLAVTQGESGSTIVGSETGVVVTLGAGSYAVTEPAVPANYTMTASEGCSGAVVLGGNVNCTITNTYVAPPPPPPTGCGDGPACDEGSSCIENVCVEGCGQGPACDEGFMCTEEGTCVEMVEDPTTGTVTVIKHVVGSETSASSFSLAVTQGESGSTIVGSETGVVVTLGAGSYAVTEPTVPENFTMTASEGCSGQVVLGGNVDCTITNTYVAPEPPPSGEGPTNGTVTVIKHVVGSEMPASAFTLVVAQGESSTNVTGNVEGTAVTLASGSYAVTEPAVPENFTATFSEGCVGQVVLGGNVNCTVTNTYVAPEPPPTESATGTLTVVKQLSGEVQGPTPASGFPLFVNGNSVTTGVAVTLNVGTYTVTETNQTGYSFLGFSGDCNSSGDVIVAAGESKTCLVTNVYAPSEQPPAEETPNGGGGGGGSQPPRLTVVTSVTNDNSGVKGAADFTATVVSAGVTMSVSGAGASGALVTMNSGSYTVTAATVSGYGSTMSGACAGTLSSNQTATCTIAYNDDAPVVTPPTPPETPTTGSGTSTPPAAPAPEVLGATDEAPPAPSTPETPVTPPTPPRSNRSSVTPPAPAGEVLGVTDVGADITVSATEPQVEPISAPAAPSAPGNACSWFWGWIGCYWWILLLIIVLALVWKAWKKMKEGNPKP